MALAVATIRSRIAASVDALAGWRESPWAPGLFSSGVNPDIHLSFSVEVAETEVHPEEGRQNRGLGAIANTYIELKWAHRIRSDGPVEDLDDALAAEVDAYQAVLATSQEGGLHILLDRMERDTSQEEWLLGTIRFRCIHRLALT